MHDHEHPVATERSQYRYFFTEKHHGGGTSNDARWSAQVDEAEEFAVFDNADRHELSDERQWLYGVLQDGNGQLRDLGTWEQQVAEFPFANEGQPWHGYPLWPVNEIAPEIRAGQKYRPATIVFDRMLAAGLISPSQRKRFMKGHHA